MKEVQVTFTRASFAEATIEVPDDMEVSYVVDAENPSPMAKAIWDWFDKHGQELEWSHDGIEEDVADVQEL